MERSDMPQRFGTTKQFTQKELKAPKLP